MTDPVLHNAGQLDDEAIRSGIHRDVANGPIPEWPSTLMVLHPSLKDSYYKDAYALACAWVARKKLPLWIVQTTSRWVVFTAQYPEDGSCGQSIEFLSELRSDGLRVNAMLLSVS